MQSLREILGTFPMYQITLYCLNVPKSRACESNLSPNAGCQSCRQESEKVLAASSIGSSFASTSCH